MNKIKYKGLAEKYNNYHGQPDNYFELQIEKIRKYLNVSSEKWEIKRILDVGCGAGRLMVPLIRKGGCFCTGIDNSADMIAACQETTVIPLNLHTVGFDKFKTKFRYDGIYFSMSLHQMDKQKEMIKKAFNLLAKDGKLLIITVSHKQFDEILLNKYFPTLDEIDRKRFMDIKPLTEELSKYGDIECIEEQTLYQQIPKKRYVEMIENKYISSLQLISKKELNAGVKQINNIKGKIISVPDCYTYIVVNKK